MWDFNHDQRSFDKKSWLFLVHLLMKIFLFFNLLSKTCYLSVYKQIYFFEENTDYWLRRTLLIHSFFYKKLAIKKRGLRWKKIEKLQGWTRIYLRNCQIQKIQKCELAKVIFQDYSIYCIFTIAPSYFVLFFLPFIVFLGRVENPRYCRVKN